MICNECQKCENYQVCENGCFGSNKPCEYFICYEDADDNNKTKPNYYGEY